MLAKIAVFRQNGRFPFLSYYNKDSKVRTRFLLPIIITFLAYLLLNIFTLKAMSHCRWGEVAHTIPWNLLNIVNAGNTWWYLSVNIRPCLLISGLIQNGTFHTFVITILLYSLPTIFKLYKFVLAIHNKYAIQTQNLHISYSVSM